MQHLLLSFHHANLYSHKCTSTIITITVKHMDKFKFTKRFAAEFAALLLAFLIAGSVAQQITQQPVTSRGYIKGVGCALFSNYACTTPLGTVDWGNMSADQVSTLIIYVKNNGSLPITLSLSNIVFQPPQLNSSLILTWNRNGFVLVENASASAVLTLTVSANPNHSGNFNVSAVIAGVY